ncbi:MAG: PP2C family protein-serine/threonine phosphatase [Acidobacteriaceae bacterium]
MRKVVVLLWLFLPAVLLAQEVNIPTGACVWRAGDDPGWAAATLDETAWIPYSAWQLSPAQPHIWIRCHADLSALRGLAQPALQIRLYAAYQVFVNGRLTGSAGNLESGGFSMNLIRSWALPRESSGPSTIALRTTWRYTSAVPFGPYPALDLLSGSLDNLRDHRSAAIVTGSTPFLIPALCFCIVGIVGLIILGLWLNDRSRYELLLLGINCIALPPIYLNYVGIAGLLAYPAGVYFALWAVPALATNICRTLFFFALAGRRVPWFFWILIATATAIYFITVAIPLLSPAQSLWLDGLRAHRFGAVSQLASVLESTAPFFAFWPWRKLSSSIRPLAALCMMWGATMMVFFFVRFTGAQLLGLPNLQSRWSNVVSDFEAVATLGVLIGLLTLLSREQQQTSRERAVLAGEMQAAQQVQRILAPSVLDTAPGIRLAAAFHPIREVGGDFYSCSILPGNRQRILLGDVSGKGAAAAMAAAVLLGAAQGRDTDAPGALLDHLNGVLTKMRLGGFATCLCAELSATGTLTLANAGHLPPYRNGEEMKLDPGLPLGITEDGKYHEAEVQLSPGDSLTFISDGVVEAHRGSGELFGFDRAAAISHQTAEEIASAAQSFGQEDDITVLKLHFAPAQTFHG